VQETFVPGAAGVMVLAFAGTLDLDRFDRVIARIIKGIFFAERGERLPSHYAVVCYSTAGLTQVPAAEGRQMQAFIESLMVPEPKYIGGPQCLFWSDYNPSDTNESRWLLVIHRHHFFIGWTVRRD
jgi:hypothetical protein